MNRGFTFATLACAASAVFAANTVSPTFLWDASTDTMGRVITGSSEETSGYWFTYDDANDNGNSHFIFPPEFDLNTYDSYPFALMIEAYGGIKLGVVLDDGYEYPYVGLGFNIWNEDQEAADITAWGGICLEYSSGLDFEIRIESENDGSVTSKTFITKAIAKSDTVAIANFEWKNFQGDMVDSATRAAILSNAAIVKLHFSGEVYTTGDFFLKKIGSLGQCSGGSEAVKLVANSRVNVSLSGRMVNFGGVAASAKVSVMDLQGHVVKSATAASSVDLRALPAGIYMLRVQGHGVNHTQKIILK